MTQITTEQARKATIELAEDMNGIESPTKKSPDLTKVTSFGKKYGHKAEQLVRSTPGAVIFGRSVELSQMPESNIKQRGYTKDIDLFVPNQKVFVKKATKKLGREFKATMRESGNYLIERKDGRDAFDLHTKPSSYSKPESKSKDAYINALPSKTSDILKRGGITQEKLYVQARRKAVATLGNSNDYTPKYKQSNKSKYGPQEHRIKDPYDLIRYGKYFAEVKTRQLRKQPSIKNTRELAKIRRIQTNVNTIKEYFSQPKVYSKYEDGSTFGKKFKSFKSNKPKKTQRKQSHAEKFTHSLLGW
jgi:hypothetical protein